MGGASRRCPEDDAVRHRHDQVHLLRILPGSMPGRRYSRDPTSNSQQRPTRSSCTIRRNFSTTVTSGRRRSLPTLRQITSTDSMVSDEQWHSEPPNKKNDVAQWLQRATSISVTLKRPSIPQVIFETSFCFLPEFCNIYCRMIFVLHRYQ